MKTAIYIEGGSTQVVLTPENELEKRIVRGVETDRQRVSLYRAGFYECRGGYFRQSGDEESLILRVDPMPESPSTSPTE